MSRRAASGLALALALAASPAAALQRPACGKDATPPAPDPRICSFRYEDRQVYRIELTALGVTTVHFDPEDDADLGGGVNPDAAALDVKTVDNLLLLRPVATDRGNRVYNMPVFTIDKRTKERRPYEFEIVIRPKDKDASENGGAIARAVFTYPGRAEALRRWEARERAKSAPTAAELDERRAADRLEVAHFGGAHERDWSEQSAGPGRALLEEMVAAGFRISDNGQVTTFDMPAGVPGVGIFWVDAAGNNVMTNPVPKEGGAVVVPRVARHWRLVRGSGAATAVVCLFRDKPIVHRDPGTGTIDPGVTVVPRARRASHTTAAGGGE